MKRQLILWPAQVLREKSIIIEKIDDDILQLSEDLFKIMHNNKGIGLAANQIGVKKRIFVMDVPDTEFRSITAINPEIKSIISKEKKPLLEGCLSLPGQNVTVFRHDNIIVRFFDINFKEIILQMSGLAAVCFQHELDHLDGKLIIDYLDMIKKSKLYKKYGIKT